LAIRDVALLLAYCYKCFDEIVELEDPLDILFKEIIVSGNLDEMFHIEGVSSEY